MNVSAGTFFAADEIPVHAGENAARLSVLVLSPEPRVHGGVSVFIATLKAHLQRSRATPFWVGARQGQKEHWPGLVARLIGAPFRVLLQLRRHAFDVVHINPSLDFKSVLRDGLILAALRIAGFRRTLVYFHGYDMRFGRRLLELPLACKAFAWAMNGAERVMVLSTECGDLLAQMGVERQKIRCTRTMFDGALLKGAAQNAATGQRRSVLFMSRFERMKGVYELLDAFARITGDFADVDLIMAGDGAENESLRARAAAHGLGNRVTFTGYVMGEEKAGLLAGCTVFALPTFFTEGMPVALLEAMGAGKPLLTVSAGGIGDIVREPDNGVILQEVSVESVEAALRRLLGDHDYCRAVGGRNADYAWSRFEAATVTAEIEAEYLAIAQS